MQIFLEALHKIDCHFRLEDDEEGFILSIIDRKEYPRVWADNYQDGMIKVIAETTENIINKTILAGKDWVERFHGITLNECIELATQWAISKGIQFKAVSAPEMVGGWTEDDIYEAIEYGVCTAKDALSVQQRLDAFKLIHSPLPQSVSLSDKRGRE